jgi:hypothetical protein
MHCNETRSIKTQSTINTTYIHRSSTEQFRMTDPHIFTLDNMANPYTGLPRNWGGFCIRYFKTVIRLSLTPNPHLPRVTRGKTKPISVAATTTSPLMTPRHLRISWSSSGSGNDAGNVFVRNSLRRRRSSELDVLWICNQRTNEALQFVTAYSVVGDEKGNYEARGGRYQMPALNLVKAVQELG